MDVAWKGFQEEYQGYAAAFDRTIQCEEVVGPKELHSDLHITVAKYMDF